jgi:phosphotriesterase-related protein
MAPREKRVLRAGARAARRTGATLSIHPPLHHEKSPAEYGLEILDIVEEEGLDPGRVVLGHQDYCDEIDHPDIENQRDLARRGAYVEFDLWGWGMYIESEAHASPSDNWRARAAIELIEDGYVENLLFSHDICTNPQRKKYGGFGYSHILENVVPMLANHGVAERDIQEIIRKNPQRMLTFAEPEGRN